ncbi:UNKNOWN [Stylonychia lemnae]|uniref:Uncharacterized protein n=1 Tax=Stylonychia lemnae TaxID=5949 RepID=A0A077ZPR0_STYLE|nr:UNKNOWN [Stylonychia lemnae]|eukprot:CDW71449.1 UNKNOWN [Stylonychia lemnae]
MNYVQSYAVVDKLIDVLLDKVQTRMIIGDIEKKMNPFVNERVLADCRATLYFFTIFHDNNKCYIEKDEYEEPYAAKPDNGATDYIAKNKFRIPENVVNLQLPPQESNPEFSIFKDQSMLSLLSQKVRSKQNSSSMSKNPKKQIEDDKSSTIKPYENQVVKLDLKGANDDEDDHVIITRKFFIPETFETELTKQNMFNKFPSTQTIIIQNSQQKSMTEDEQLISTVLNETVDINDPYKSFGEKKEFIIPTDQYNPSTGIVIKGGVKLKDKSSLKEGGDYESQMRKNQHELIMESQLNNKTLKNVLSSINNLQMRRDNQDDILIDQSAKEKIREIASRGAIGISSQARKRISNRIIRNSINVSAENTLIIDDNPRSLNQSINYLESLKSHEQLGEMNPLLNVISYNSSQMHLLANDPYSNIKFQSPQLVNKHPFNNLNRSMEQNINKQGTESSNNLYFGLGGERDSKQNRRYLMTRNSMQLAEQLKTKPSQDRIAFGNRNNSIHNTHNLASLNTSIVSGSSLQKRIRTGNVNNIKQIKNQTLRLRNFRIGGGQQNSII